MGHLHFGLVALAAVAVRAEPPEPPVAEVRSQRSIVHGQERIDDYHWLRTRGDAAVIHYLEAENAYCDALLKHTAKLQEQLYQEMVARLKEDDQTVPVRDKSWYYYTRTEKGKQYPLHCRKRGRLDAPEEIILDPNALATGHDYFRVTAVSPSPDHALLAYLVDTSGAEAYTLFIKDLRTGEVRGDTATNLGPALAWAMDNRTLFYVTLDAAKRPFKVFRHRLGEAPADDVLVYHEADDAFFVNISRTRSDAFLTIFLRSNTTNEVRVLDAFQPLGEWRVVRPRARGVEYRIAHRDDHFYVMTNQDAANFRLERIATDPRAGADAEVLLPHRAAVTIDGIDAFADHLVVYEREEGLTHVRVMNLVDGTAHRIGFDEPVYTVRRSANREFTTTRLRLNYESLVTPDSVLEYDMNARTQQVLKRQEVLGGFDPANYAQARILATAADGTQVPISVLHRKDIKRDGSNPTLLYGYGSYGISIDPGFSSTRFSLVDRGFVFAIAHVRGGGALGRTWYEHGKLLHKKNTFTDFVACAEHLIRERYTTSECLAIQGGSAGGLLMGAVTNMRPDLFAAVNAEVPFVDVVNTMLDPTLPLTVIEYEEWGNPNDKQYFDYMLSYSPYDNVRAQDYPAMLVTTGINDPRVQYWEPAKWTARLRRLKTDDNPLMFHTHMGAGHGGASGRYARLREIARSYAFFIDQVAGPGRSQRSVGDSGPKD